MMALVTVEVVIVKYGEELEPAATVADAGTVTRESPLDRFTTTPPAGAGPFRLTLFNVEEAPPTKDVGDNVTEDKATGFTVKVVVFVIPLYLAEMVTAVVTATDVVVIVNTSEAATPAATVTEG